MEHKFKHKKGIISSFAALALVAVIGLQAIFPTSAVKLDFDPSGTPGHPNIYLTDGTGLLCLNNGSLANGEIDYHISNDAIDYFNGSTRMKRLFWAYMMCREPRRYWIDSNYSRDDINGVFAKYKEYSISNNEAKEVAWDQGRNAINNNIEWLVNNGFMSLQNQPDGCKSPEDVYNMISQYATPETAMPMYMVQKGPGEIDGEKLYDMMGLSSMEYYKQYTTMTIISGGEGWEVYWDDYNGWQLRYTGIPIAGQTKLDAIVRVDYDQTRFSVIKASGELRTYSSSTSGAQNMYCAHGKIEEVPCFFYIVFGTPDTTIPSYNPDQTTGGDMTTIEVPKVVTYQHRETFVSTYALELGKYDYETGEPLAESYWEIDESFDASQLSSDETTNGIMEKYMRDEPNTWDDWMVFNTRLSTDTNGELSNVDYRYYDFQQAYCNGHPLPPEPDDDDDDDAYEAAMAIWQEMVDDCAAKAADSNGHFHHWLCNSESTPSESESWTRSGAEAARDATYQNFVNLVYEYTVREDEARDGYTLHYINGHDDDVPIEIISTNASEAEYFGTQTTAWIDCDNYYIKISSYRQNYIVPVDDDDDDTEPYSTHLVSYEERIEAYDEPNFLQRLFSNMGFKTITPSYTYKITVLTEDDDTATPSDAEEDEFADYEIYFDDEATPSDASRDASSLKLHKVTGFIDEGEVRNEDETESEDEDEEVTKRKVTVEPITLAEAEEMGLIQRGRSSSLFVNDDPYDYHTNKIGRTTTTSSTSSGSSGVSTYSSKATPSDAERYSDEDDEDYYYGIETYSAEDEFANAPMTMSATCTCDGDCECEDCMGEDNICTCDDDCPCMYDSDDDDDDEFGGSSGGTSSGNYDDDYDDYDDDDDDDDNGYDPYTGGAVWADEADVIDSQPTVTEGPHNNTFWRWVIYDHRTEGEIHFNKRDFDLEESDEFDSYGIANADGSLEGAVYGLFAADPIYHPDTQFKSDVSDIDPEELTAEDLVEKGTGLLFDANDLVAVATTDRNGDGSFMTITERPHTIYDYETGTITYTGKDYPENYFDHDGYDKVYSEEELGRLYENNVEKNGDYWIGRPLFVGNYYIKELSRSEGYELSITGADMDYTNRPDDGDVNLETEPVGYAWVSDQLMYANTFAEENTTINGTDQGEVSGNILTLTTSSVGTSDGYNVVISGVGPDSTIYQMDNVVTRELQMVPVDTKTVVADGQTVTNDDGTTETHPGPEYQTAEGNYTPKTQQDGSYIQKDEDDITKYPYHTNVTGSVIDPVVNTSASVSYSDTSYANRQYQGTNETYPNGSAEFRYTKAMAEEALRNIGMETPYLSHYSENEEGGLVYDEETTISGKTVYGRPEMTLQLNGVSTCNDIIEGIVHYFQTETEYNFSEYDDKDNNGFGNATITGGSVFGYASVQNIVLQGTTASVTLAVCTSPTNYSVVFDYDEASDEIKAVYYYKLNADYGRYIVRIYLPGNFDATFPSSTLRTLCEIELWPDYTVDSNGNVEDLYTYGGISDQYLCYDDGDILYDYWYWDESRQEWVGHEPLYETEVVVIYGEEWVETENTEATQIKIVTEEDLENMSDEQKKVDTYAVYDSTTDQWTVHVGVSDDFDETTIYETDFCVKMPASPATYTLTAEDIDYIGGEYNVFIYNEGDSIPYSEYAIILAGASAGVYVSELFDNSEVYATNVNILYSGELFAEQDALTSENTIQVYERPIKQQVKVVKDVLTTEDGDYAHDTYSSVHSENLSYDSSTSDDDSGSSSLITRVIDWLTRLLNGNVGNESPSEISNFRFKAYLKSNLERLYRDEDGNITWLDRNGNVLTPVYVDNDGDGNYDTFYWQYRDIYRDADGNITYEETGTHLISDFPEEAMFISNETSAGESHELSSSNVQKIYTEIGHNAGVMNNHSALNLNSGSTTVGDISNNVWAEYGNPQITNNIENVGEKEGFTTSLDGDDGIAVYPNAALYSYNGNNINVKETDKINESQNEGYTRILETTLELIEDGAGETREIESYNYEKFFDALATANKDVWDDDMHSTYTINADGSVDMSNYPGQNWFDTFDEKYQMDDADPDHTIENTDAMDEGATEEGLESAGGDRDTSFKPFAWIREHLFGTTEDAKNDYKASHNNENLENTINTSDYARKNAEASDAVRQFAIDWYLEDEVAKLVKNNGYDEDEAYLSAYGIESGEEYQDEVYDIALYNAIGKAYNYLKPFYTYDLDTIYAVEWDSANNGGVDGDLTTLSASTHYAGDDSTSGYYYGVSSYLPYGTYVIVEQQPSDDAYNDFENRHYKTDAPKEVTLPAVYETDGNLSSPEYLDSTYEYDSTKTPEAMAGNYYIRFNEEISPNNTMDERAYVIRAHNTEGDFEVYKFGLNINQTGGSIEYNDGSEYDFDGFSVVQEDYDPIKDTYNIELVDDKQHGGNTDAHYYADDDNTGDVANTSSDEQKTRTPDTIEARYHYASLSENSGKADNVLFQHGENTDDNNPSGFYFKDNVNTMTGNRTAYEGLYSSTLVPWSVITPEASDIYDSLTFSGYADAKFRNTFYTTKLRIEKLDSETGENIIHDDAVFAIYAGSRYNSVDEIEADAELIKDDEEYKTQFLNKTRIGDVRFFMTDTEITGTKEFLESMGAYNLVPINRDLNSWTGTVSEGTPICVEDERIIMEDVFGNRTGEFKVYSTMNDVEMANPEDRSIKEYSNQNTGYLVTPEPLGAGVYVLAETAPPAGYARSKPVAVEVYSDGVTYYLNGLRDQHVDATVYTGNIVDELNN